MKNIFGNIFLIDAFIANSNRHNGDWGFLYNKVKDKVKLAPIIDCESSLFNLLDEESIQEYLSAETKIKPLVYEEPTSPILVNGKRGNYFEIISSLNYEGCKKTIKRIVPRINLDKIKSLIDEVQIITDLEKEFLKTILK